MDSKLPEKNLGSDAFRSPDHKVPNKFESKSMIPERNPYIKRDLSKKSLSKESTIIFGKHGISRSRFREELGKAYDSKINMDKSSRRKLEKEMPWGNYGETISEKDIESHLKSLKKEKRSVSGFNNIKMVKDKIKLLENLKKKK